MRTSRTTQVLDELRDMIVRAEFKPGEKLRIDRICEMLPASLGAVREALSRLSAEGLVESLPQRGFIVAPVSFSDLRDLTDVRVAIEEECLRRAIRNGDLRWEAEIVASFHRLSHLPLYVEGTTQQLAVAWGIEHRAFHQALTAACDNVWWLRLRQQLFMQSERYRALTGPYAETARDVEGEHQAIMEATLARDADAAVALMGSHLRATTAILLSSSALVQADGVDDASKMARDEKVK